jgi:hypothetical protein
MELTKIRDMVLNVILTELKNMVLQFGIAEVLGYAKPSTFRKGGAKSLPLENYIKICET